MSLSLIVCTTKNGLIGRNNKLPWRHAEDLRYFRKVTTQGEGTNVLLMGWNTWLSIGKVLPNRISAVVTSKHLEEFGDELPKGLELWSTIESALKAHQEDNVYVIGGGQIYNYVLDNCPPERIYHTLINQSPTLQKDDIVFQMERLNNEWRDSWWYDSQEGSDICFRELVPKCLDERSYLHMLNKILTDGCIRGDRTGTGTKSLFGQRLEFSLANQTIPLLTTKRVAFKTLARELLWFISGSTNTKILEQQGVKIWTGNTSRQFLDSHGLTSYQEGELGPGYGFQWRHAGAQYHGLDHDYTGEGVDQLQNMIDLVKKDPNSRRILMSAWGVSDLEQMALPPCHIMYQLYVHDGKLSAQMYQRSADCFLGVPFNIASYALLTHIIAQLTGLEADKLVMAFGDTHIYLNHIDQVHQQLNRSPRQLPKIKFNRDLKDQSIDSVSINDFSIVGYWPHPTIKAKMSV